MKLRYLLPLFFAIVCSSNAYSVTSTISLEQTQLTSQIEQNDYKSNWFSRTATKVKNGVAVIKSGLLDNPRRILIYAGIALLGGIVFTLLAGLIGIGILGTLSWLLYIVGFALVILWVYTVIIKRQ